MNKEVNLLTDSQIEDVVENLKIDIVKNRDFKKEDHIMRKYYNICETLRRVGTQEFVEYLEQHPVESKMFTIMLWNGLVDSCENILTTYKNPEEYKVDEVALTGKKNNKYVHVLNDLLSSMLEKDEYYTIQADALNYAIDRITCKEVDACTIDKLKKEVLSDPNLKAQYEKETETYDTARYLRKIRVKRD